MAGPGTLIGGVVAVGVGEAASTALDPVLEPQRQAAWAKSQARIFDLGTLAELVAQGLLTEAAAITEGRNNGYSKDCVQRAIQLALKAAPVAELLELWRRGEFGDPTLPASAVLVDHGLAKAGIEPQYWEHIKHLFYGRLDPAVIALAIVRGIMPDPGFLPVPPPTTEGNVKAFPVSKLDPIIEARAQGINKDRLFVETAIAGRPMGPEAAAAATFKQILLKVDYQRAIAEGDVRNEWAEAIFENARPIPHPLDYVQARLRGWTDDAGMHDGAHRSGMRDADTDLLFKIHGRPLSWHQVWIGLQRGGTYDGPITDIDPAFLHALRQSDIRPEWYNLAWHSRYTYPSAFVLRALTQDHTLTAAQAEADLIDMGWRPDRAKQAAEHWAGGSGAKADPHVAKAQTQLWTATHRSYIAQEITPEAATGSFDLIGIPADVQPEIFALWEYERGLRRAQLSPADVRKAFQQGDLNAAAGAAWTRDEALTALLDRGWGANDANDYLNIPYKG